MRQHSMNGLPTNGGRSPRASGSRGPPTTPGGSPLYGASGQPYGRPPLPHLGSAGAFFSPPGLMPSSSSSRMMLPSDYRQPAAYRDVRNSEETLSNLRKENEERRQRQLKRAQTAEKLLDEEAESQRDRARESEQQRWMALMEKRESARQAFTLRREESMKLSETIQPGASRSAARWHRESGNLESMLASSTVPAKLPDFRFDAAAAATAAADVAASVGVAGVGVDVGGGGGFGEGGGSKGPRSPGARSPPRAGSPTARPRGPSSPKVTHEDLRARLPSMLDDLQRAVQQAAVGSPDPGSQGWTGGALSMAELAELARSASVDEELERRQRLEEQA